MKLTILETGSVPAIIADDFPAYSEMFVAMFARAGADMDFDVVPVALGAPLPDPHSVEAVLITGSPAGVYDDLPWMDPLRAFIGTAYAARTRMVGICFGHQIVADALGGDVRQSEKGWGLGRHRYTVHGGGDIGLDVETVSVACSHQDQVVVPPSEARPLLSSDFAPYAGLVYANGAVLTVQPHPEFDDAYTDALIDLREGHAPPDVIAAARASMATASDGALLARALVRFLRRERRGQVDSRVL